MDESKACLNLEVVSTPSVIWLPSEASRMIFGGRNFSISMWLAHREETASLFSYRSRRMRSFRSSTEPRPLMTGRSEMRSPDSWRMSMASVPLIVILGFIDELSDQCRNMGSENPDSSFTHLVQ